MNTFGRAEAVTVHDSTNQTHFSVEIYVGGAGNAVVVLEDDSTITLNGLLAGHRYPIRAKRINSTSTTATNLVFLHLGERVVGRS